MRIGRWALSYVSGVYSGPWPPRQVWPGNAPDGTRYWLYGPFVLERFPRAESRT
jgi:hypothetical protein